MWPRLLLEGTDSQPCTRNGRRRVNTLIQLLCVPQVGQPMPASFFVPNPKLYSKHYTSPLALNVLRRELEYSSRWGLKIDSSCYSSSQYSAWADCFNNPSMFLWGLESFSTASKLSCSLQATKTEQAGRATRGAKSQEKTQAKLRSDYTHMLDKQIVW